MESLSFLSLWGIRLVRNSNIIEDTLRPSFQTMAQIWALMSHFRTTIKLKVPRNLDPLQIDKTNPWAFFDGACKARDMMLGLRFILYLSDAHSLFFQENGGRGTNNYGEFDALFYLLKFSFTLHLTSFLVKGNSLLTIRLMNVDIYIINISLS